MTEKLPETRRHDPFRREPPTIDLKAKDLSPKAPPTPEGPKAADLGKPSDAVASAAKPEPAKPAGVSAASTRPATAEGPGSSRPASARPPDSGAAKPGPGGTAKPDVPPKPALSAGAAKGATPPVGPDTARAGRGTGALAATGLIGGLVGAALALGADRLIVNQPTGGTDARLAALEQRVGDPSALDRRVGSLETASKATSDQLAAARGAADAARQAAAASTGPRTDPALADTLGKLTGRLAALEDGLREGVSSVRSNAGAVGDLKTEMAGLATGLDAQTKQAGAAAQANAAALAELTARVAAVQSQSAERTQAAATTIQALQSRVGDGEKRLTTLSDDLAKFGPAAAQAGLRVVVAGRLDDAIRDGRPLGPILATLGRIGTPAASLEPLKAYADAPPPSAAALAAEFKPIGDRLIEASRGPAVSIGDRLLRMADKIVTVRSVGDAGDGDATALVGRIDAALARGALGEAAKAWDALPEPARTASADWAARLKRREAAGDAARRLQSEALASIDASLR